MPKGIAGYTKSKGNQKNADTNQKAGKGIC